MQLLGFVGCGGVEGRHEELQLNAIVVGVASWSVCCCCYWRRQLYALWVSLISWQCKERGNGWMAVFQKFQTDGSGLSVYSLGFNWHKQTWCVDTLKPVQWRVLASDKPAETWQIQKWPNQCRVATGLTGDNAPKSRAHTKSEDNEKWPKEPLLSWRCL